jgi:hypothetical protein
MYNRCATLVLVIDILKMYAFLALIGILRIQIAVTPDRTIYRGARK